MRLPHLPALWLAAVCATASPAAAQTFTAPIEISREQATVSRLILESVLGAPARVRLFDQATLRLEGSLQYIDRDLASRYLRAHSLPQPDGLVGLFVHGGREVPWMATIRFVRDGFVDLSLFKRWTHDDILASLRDEVARENEDRAARRLPPRVISGWRIPPRVDPDNNSLVWSVTSYVPGVSSQNESDATVHVAVFGREGYFQIDIVTAGSTLREYPQDIPTIVQNLRFVEGKQYRDYVAGDPVARDALENLFDVKTLRPLGWMENHLDSDMIVVLSVGGGLVLGAGALGLGLLAANRRRNRRRL